MKTLVTEGIVLSRTNYGEADRIITILTPAQGKLRLMAKGVRKVKSKLAGGIELFSVSELSYISGRNELGTLVSTRLKTYYSHIVEDMDRVQLGYELIKLLNKVTEDSSDASYFSLLEQSFQALDNPSIGLVLIRTWFKAQLIRDAGHIPNLSNDIDGNKLSPQETYNFDIERMAFVKNKSGSYSANHIKTLRLLFSPNPPEVLSRIEELDTLLPILTTLINTLLEVHL
ncbi:MAG TPA: DNA repair protein RecO [Candidatus Saccharimonadales bacterium]|nr:DNA repair protein RecO [Candidatus Saccharimonadales bacterium]